MLFRISFNALSPHLECVGVLPLRKRSAGPWHDDGHETGVSELHIEVSRLQGRTNSTAFHCIRGFDQVGGVVWKSFLNWLSHPSEKVGKLFLCKAETGS